MVVTQKLTIGESTNNLYELFNDLIPESTTDVVTITANPTATTVTATTIDNSIVTLKGQGTVGQKYYSKDGELLSSAPSLPLLSTIEV